eukprot:403361412
MKQIKINAKLSLSKKSSNNVLTGSLSGESPNHQVIETNEVVQCFDENGRRQVNQYVFQETIGQGAFGKVKLAHLKEDPTQLYAVKVFRKSQLLKKKEYFRKKEGGMGFKSQLSKVQQEIAIMKKLVHPNLIQLYEVIDYDEGDKLYMIMDYAQNGEILKWNQKTCRFRPFQNGLDQLLESDIKKYMRHCIRGLHFMHSNNIVHRDIKPQNILITDNFKAKLGDFGVSQLYEREEDDKISKTEGTYHFMAPECCDPDVESFSGKAADIWALGVTLYCMVFNELPFWDETEFGIIQKIHKEEIKISESRQISKGLRHLLSRMLEKNPEKRAQIQELRENSWINEGCKTALIQEETSFISELTEADLQHALTPIHRIVFAKKFGKQ